MTWYDHRAGRYSVGNHLFASYLFGLLGWLFWKKIIKQTSYSCIGLSLHAFEIPLTMMFIIRIYIWPYMWTHIPSGWFEVWVTSIVGIISDEEIDMYQADSEEIVWLVLKNRSRYSKIFFSPCSIDFVLLSNNCFDWKVFLQSNSSFFSNTHH